MRTMHVGMMDRGFTVYNIYCRGIASCVQTEALEMPLASAVLLMI
jgi:hypothetical protein